jgi:hypothetical protein
MGFRLPGVQVVPVLAVVLAGCGGGTVAVRGLVTLEGTPVSGATVLFMPDGQDGGRPASGFTLSDGRFLLTTYKSNDGAMPGNYRVLIKKTEASKDPEEANRSALDRAKAKFEEESSQKLKKSTLPEVYANFDTTPLRCTVPVSGVVTLELHKTGK